MSRGGNAPSGRSLSLTDIIGPLLLSQALGSTGMFDTKRPLSATKAVFLSSKQHENRLQAETTQIVVPVVVADVTSQMLPTPKRQIP